MKAPTKTWMLALLWSLVLGAWSFTARGAFVYETAAEFLTSGDFNGDGIPDVLVLDKVTGNVRIGYQNPAGAVTWSPSLATGAENISGCALEHFLLSDRDSLAVTARGLNRLNLLDLSNTNSVPAPTAVSPVGIGPHAVVGLKSPTAPPSGAPPFMLVASSFNDPPPERLDLFMYFGAPVNVGQFNETGSFERGNSLDLNTNTATLAVGLARGANDTLQIWQFTNSAGVLGALSNLPPGGDYAFGNFNLEPFPRFWFYVPGGTNVSIYPLVTNGAGFAFGAATTLAFTQSVERVYIVGASNDASAMIQFGDGIQGARLPGGSPSLAAKYAAGGGSHFTGVAALNDGKFILLSAPTGTVSSVGAQVMAFNGTNYTQVSSNNLPALTTRSSRATVWLFQNEPFVNASANFVASLNAPDWSSSANGLPGALSVRVEADTGVGAGLGSPATNSYTPAGGSAYGLPDQYRDDVSLFSYASPRPAESVDATISPPPGIYDGAVTISFTKQHSFDTVFYRVDTAAWQTFATPFALTHNATIQFYARSPGGPTAARSPLHFAAYTLGATGETPPDPIVLTNRVFTNLPPPLNTNVLQIAGSGTVFFSRHSALAELSSGFQGPSPYLNFTNSPFSPAGFNYFYLENFEDGALNTPGATPSAGWVVIGPGTVDSVEPGGHSYYSNGNQTNLTITFDAAALGGHLPTHAGILWTDVGNVTSGVFGHGNVIFSARDANGVSLGTNVGVNLGDGSASPSQAEDRFFGVVNRGGISSISITMTNSKDWELDHLQYGYLDAAGFDDSIWAIDLDGNGEAWVANGEHPRVSRDGQWLAFLRDGKPYSSQGNLWVKNFSTGVESIFFTNADTIIGIDWNGSQPELVFDNDCALWRRSFNGPLIQLSAALTPECYNGAPVVNPVNGQLAFHNVNPGASQGVYVTPPGWSSRAKLAEPSTLRWRWPAWSFDGARLAMADRTSSAFINTGVNLWTALADGSNPKLITALTDPDGFPDGAIWTPSGNGLVGAGAIGGTNGLWFIPVAADGAPCHCPPRLLPTSPGNPIDFAGSIVVPPPPAVAKPGLFIRTEPNAIVVYWSTNYDGFILEYTTVLARNSTWTEIEGPYFLAGAYYEYHEAKSSLAAQHYYRLRNPGVIFLTPSEATLSFELQSQQIVLTWPADYVGYTLESTTNLLPAAWTPVTGAYGLTNGQFEFHQNLLSTKPREFFRLRWP